MVNQKRNVLLSVLSEGEVDGDDIESVVEILPKGPFLMDSSRFRWVAVMIRTSDLQGEVRIPPVETPSPEGS